MLKPKGMRLVRHRLPAFWMLTLLAAVAHADPARFWFSLSPEDPFRDSLYQPSSNGPGAPSIDLIPGASQTLHLWARPQTVDLAAPYAPAEALEPNPFRTLQNVSFNLHSPTGDSVLTVDRVRIENPTDPADPTQDRFGVVIDSDNPIELFTDNGLVTYPEVSSTGVDRFAGFTLTAPHPFMGLGPNCGSGCVVAQDGVPAWRLGSVDLIASGLGQAEAFLQVGSLSITHANEAAPDTRVLFGEQGVGVDYFAGDERETTKSGDTADLVVNVLTNWPGDFSGDNTVDAADYTLWRDAQGTGLGYQQWSGNYGRGPAGMSNVVSTPEPTAIAAALFGMAVLLARRPRPGISVACCLFVVCLAMSPRAHAVQLNANWLSAANGDWDDPANWSTVAFPNNAADTYAVTIDETGSPYTITLDTDVTVDSVTLDSADATLNVASTLSIDQTFALNSGTLRLLNGRLSGGTLTQAGGGTLAFLGTDNRLIGVTLQDGLSIDPLGEVRFQVGATFNGTAAVDRGSILAIDDDLSLTDQVIELNNGQSSDDPILGLVGNRTLTIGASAQIDMNARSRIISDQYETGTSTLVNEGMINVPNVSGERRRIEVDVFDNRGTVNAEGWLQFWNVTPAWSNSGVIVAGANSTVEFSGGGSATTSSLGLIDGSARLTGSSVTFNNAFSLDNSGDTLALSADTTGTYIFTNSTITGGSVTQSGGATARFNGGNGVLDGVSFSGGLDLSMATAGVRLRNGSTFFGTATLGDSAVLAAEDDLTFLDQTIDLSGSNTVGATLGVVGNNTLTLGPGAVVNMGADAEITSDLFTPGAGTVVNQGRVNVLQLSGSDPTISADSFVNQGRIHLETSATLDITGGFTHTGDAELTGGGSVDIATFTNAARVRPGNSPGILTIIGDYTQTADGELEIEVAGLVPGSGHDQLRVTGATGLAGRLDLPMIDGFVPTVGDEVSFLVALGASPITGKFDVVEVSGLPEDVAQRIVYSATEVKAEFVAVTPIQFVSSDAVAEWSTLTDWEESGSPATPDSVNVLSVSNNRAMGQSQTVEVLPPMAGAEPNAAHSLTIADATDEIVVLVSGTSLSTSLDTTVSANGALELTDTSTLAARSLEIEGGGRFSGGGTIIADVEVGVAGAGDATFEIGRGSVSTVAIEGGYTQGSDSVLKIDIAGPNSGGNHDSATVDDDVSVSGVIEIDLAGLAPGEFTPGDGYDLIATEGTVTGEFTDIEIVGRDDIYFDITYGAAPAAAAAGEIARLTAAEREIVRATGFYKGDGDQDGDIDEIDAEIFAAFMLDNGVFFYDYGEGIAAANFRDAFDFTDTTPGDERTVDFYDIPRFTQALASFQGMSLASAQAEFRDALSRARYRLSIPEPTNMALLLIGAACISLRRKWGGRA